MFSDFFPGVLGRGEWAQCVNGGPELVGRGESRRGGNLASGFASGSAEVALG